MLTFVALHASNRFGGIVVFLPKPSTCNKQTNVTDVLQMCEYARRLADVLFGDSSPL
jgi:hypothetical protein